LNESERSWISYRRQQDAIERREGQLWWLAILVIFLLSAGVVALNLPNAGENLNTGLVALFDNRVMLYSLLAAVFLICAYFRDSVRRLRRWNNQLLSDLEKQSDLLARKSTQMAQLKDVSDRLLGNLDTAEGLDFLLGLAMNVSGAQYASILLVDEETRSLERYTARSLVRGGEPNDEAYVNRSAAQWVIDNAKPLLLNLESDTEVSTLVAPVNVGGKALGVLSVRGRVDGGGFTQDELDAICTLASQAALGIEKMHLYRKLQEQVVCLRKALHELHQAQASLIQNEKLASIGQLAGGMAHEINNPLLIILGRAELLLMDVDPSSPNAGDLEIIKSETERIAGIVRNLLSFSRADRTGILSMVDVNEIMERTLQLVETQESTGQIATIRRLSGDIPPVYAEKGEIQQVFMNIVINAYQAMRSTGGKLIVETSQDDAGYVVAKFADTGPGIPREHLGRIFDPFFTSKPESEGTGLGLSVSRGIVEKYGGKIEVETRIGEGATFIVKLPAAEEALKDMPKVA